MNADQRNYWIIGIIVFVVHILLAKYLPIDMPIKVLMMILGLLSIPLWPFVIALEVAGMAVAGLMWWMLY